MIETHTLYRIAIYDNAYDTLFVVWLREGKDNGRQTEKEHHRKTATLQNTMITNKSICVALTPYTTMLLLQTLTHTLTA